MDGNIYKAKVNSTVGQAWTAIDKMGIDYKKLIAVYFSANDGSEISLREALDSFDNKETRDDDYDIYKAVSGDIAVTDVISPRLPTVGKIWYYDSKSGGGNTLIIKYSIGE